MQLRQAAAVRVGDEQVQRSQRVRELVLQANAQLLQALCALTAHQHRVGVREAQLLAGVLVEQVDLVEHQQARALLRADLLQRLLHRPLHDLALGLRHGGVEHVHELLRAARLLERRRERVDQLVGEL